MPRKKRTGPAFTVETPEPLPASREGEAWWLERDGRRVRLSNLDKVFWPEEGYTKGDLLAYYYNVAELILPYVRERPLTMRRMPDGMAGHEFYEKRSPPNTPEWMSKCVVPADDEGERDIDYLLAEDVPSLLFVVNMGAIEFHPLHSRCGSIDRPDYLFFDLDPFPPATFDDVLAVARHVRAALDALGLPSYPKTSGATGMQVYVGLDPQPTYDDVRGFVRALCRHINAADPDRTTMEWDISKRAGKVFLDWNMNRLGANIAAAYSVRPEPGATVSTPLSWDEVEAGVTPRDCTIANAHERFADVGDLFRGMLEEPIDIRPAMDSMGVKPDGETSPRQVATRVDPRPKRPARRRKRPSEEPTADAEVLAEYRRKRDFELTPEPPPTPKPGRDELFVIQKHDATRLHYDLRLERNGVMPSWAVPKGLPITTDEKRLAVKTEDHPIDYASFEGWIPEGEYGAGEVRIFDTGRYELLEWEDDKVSFRLHGRRQRGEYHLVKTRTDWLIFLSKRSLDEQPPSPSEVIPMMAEGGHQPFDHPDWRFEPKLDGVRTLAYVRTDSTKLVSRRGRDQTATYPELANLARWVNALQAVIDAEIVAPEEDGRPSFERLQQRMNLQSKSEIERARKKIPVALFAFDLLWLDGRDLTHVPLEQRRRLLEEIVTESGPVNLTFYTDGKGSPLFEAAREQGLEGVIAKRLGTPYLPGRRSKDWRKIKALNEQDCVILGMTPGTGSRSPRFGALLVGAYVDGALTWIGQVGTGFTDASLDDLLKRFEPLLTEKPAVDDPEVRKVKGARWLKPELVCEVEYLEMTKVGKLRAPSFKGLRPDKAPQDCILERPAR
ncbi:MAG TPA: non-homologous end-joining DNA ligase [Actinomycetota bacterium]|nr:non-homologous end-joining DNA ligase [Actinomycetota bacterium]